MDTKDEIFKQIYQEFAGQLTGVIQGPENLCKEPYDSTWERDFEWVLSKYLPNGVRLRNQVGLCGRYRADFVFEIIKTGHFHVVEYDGKQFHSAYNDKIRDKEIFEKEPRVRTITRVDASTGKWHIDSIRPLLKKLLPGCFGRVPPDPIDIDWIERDGVFEASTLKESACSETWYDEEEDQVREDAPMDWLKISHAKNPYQIKS